MKAEFEKKMKIASDLLSFCHICGAEEYHLDIRLKGDVADFIVKASPVDLSEGEIEQLLIKLNAPRHREIEQDYWALIGESEDYCELTLVGMMCDEAAVEYSGRELAITIKRRDLGNEVTSSSPRQIV